MSPEVNEDILSAWQKTVKNKDSYWPCANFITGWNAALDKMVDDVYVEQENYISFLNQSVVELMLEIESIANYIADGGIPLVFSIEIFPNVLQNNLYLVK